VNHPLITGRWQLGLGLSLLATLFYGLLPLALKSVLTGLDPFTITWSRFFIAALLMTAVVTRTKQVRSTNWNKPTIGLLLLAVGGLCSNYLLYLVGLQYVTPNTAQVLIQLAPVFLLLGSLFIFKETFTPIQWLGLGILFLGFILYFNHQLGSLFNRFEGNSLGLWLVSSAAFAWSIYGLAQKGLSLKFRSTTVVLIIYWFGTFLFWPLARPSSLLQLKSSLWLPLIFSALSTLLVYWAFAEAINHWPASRISAVLALTPIVTVVASEIIIFLWPGMLEAEHLSFLNVSGILLVITGSMLSALGQAQSTKIRR